MHPKKYVETGTRATMHPRTRASDPRIEQQLLPQPMALPLDARPYSGPRGIP